MRHVTTASRVLTVQGDRFHRGGAEHRIISGVVHYFRVPPPLWSDRLMRLRAMGCNTVETYVAWNFHQPAPGSATFEGWADVAGFCRLAGDMGLDVIVRPGPYICAEWEFGGLPAWLLADPEMQVRCGYPPYLKAVDEWFDALLPQLVPLLATRGGPIVAMQVENEYGSYGNDKSYLDHLRNGMISRGADVLLFTSDGPTDLMLNGGTLPGVLATVNFGSEPEKAFAILRRNRPDEPLMCMEFWNGWFDHWGEPHHVRDAADAADTLRRIIEAGASVNVYVGHGGTSFGWFAGANHTDEPGGYQPTVGSYDYDAPIGESGELTPKFHAFREILAPLSPTGVPEPPPMLATQTPQQLGATTGPSRTLRSMLDQLSQPIPLATPLPMERLGQSYGLIHYRTWVAGPASGTLRLVGLADRAQVFVAGELAGVVSRQDSEQSLEVTIPDGGGDIEVLVENTGRVNYGPELHDRKGLRQAWLDHQQLFGWEARPLPLDDLGAVSRALVAGPPPETAPLFRSVSVAVAADPVSGVPGDAFLALPGWSRGRIWLNGFQLGAYRTEGPQVTLYAPGPLWRVGENELLILELDQPGQMIEIRDRPDLGPLA